MYHDDDHGIDPWQESTSSVRAKVRRGSEITDDIRLRFYPGDVGIPNQTIGSEWTAIHTEPSTCDGTWRMLPMNDSDIL